MSPLVYHNTIGMYCDKYEVPVWVMHRLIEWESGWNVNAENTNKNGTVDRGLAQFNSAYLEDFARRHNSGEAFCPLDWKVSLEVAVKHLRYLYEETGSWWSAVASYNMGLRGFRDFVAGNRPLPIGTKRELDYVFR